MASGFTIVVDVGSEFGSEWANQAERAKGHKPTEPTTAELLTTATTKKERQQRRKEATGWNEDDSKKVQRQWSGKGKSNTISFLLCCFLACFPRSFLPLTGQL